MRFLFVLVVCVTSFGAGSALAEVENQKERCTYARAQMEAQLGKVGGKNVIADNNALLRAVLWGQVTEGLDCLDSDFAGVLENRLPALPQRN